MAGNIIGSLRVVLQKLDATTRRSGCLPIPVIGDRAAEIIHIGQVVLTLGATIEYFRDSVFNYPTLAEAYKVAVLDELNKL